MVHAALLRMVVLASLAIRYSDAGYRSMGHVRPPSPNNDATFTEDLTRIIGSNHDGISRVSSSTKSSRMMLTRNSIDDISDDNPTGAQFHGGTMENQGQSYAKGMPQGNTSPIHCSLSSLITTALPCSLSSCGLAWPALEATTDSGQLYRHIGARRLSENNITNIHNHYGFFDDYLTLDEVGNLAVYQQHACVCYAAAAASDDDDGDDDDDNDDDDNNNNEEDEEEEEGDNDDEEEDRGGQ